MRRILLCLTGVLCACSHEPEWRTLPMQRVFDPTSEPKVVGSIISMDSPQVDNYILKGVITREPGASWRWANPKAELRFALNGTEGVKFVADFVIADETFKTTGPVVMTFTVDGKVMGSERYDKPGEKHYETLVDGKLLRTDEPMIVAAEVDKFFVSQQDGTKLGFLLVRMGFTQ